MGLSNVGAMELSFVGAIGLMVASAIRLQPVSATAGPTIGFLAPSRLLVTYWRAAASYDCGGSPMSDRLFLARR